MTCPLSFETVATTLHNHPGRNTSRETALERAHQTNRQFLLGTDFYNHKISQQHFLTMGEAQRAPMEQFKTPYNKGVAAPQ